MSLKIAGLGAAILANAAIANEAWTIPGTEVDPATKRIDIDSANRTFIDA